MTVPRRHHYVPVFIQRRFTNGDGKLFLYSHERRARGVYTSRPEDAFVQRDLNTVEEKDGSKNVELELWYSWFEGLIAPIVERIVSRARARKEPQLTADERNAWDNFVYHQQKRAPDTFKRLGLLDEFRENLAARIDEYHGSVRPLGEAERGNLMREDTIKAMIQRASVTARGRGGGEALDALASRGIGVCVIGPPGKSFILGDHPQSRMGPNGDLRDTSTDLWMPIAPDVAVSPWGKAGTEHLLVANGDAVRRINRVIFQQSNLVGARAEALLKSLARL